MPIAVGEYVRMQENFIDLCTVEHGPKMGKWKIFKVRR